MAANSEDDGVAEIIPISASTDLEQRGRGRKRLQEEVGETLHKEGTEVGERMNEEYETDSLQSLQRSKSWLVQQKLDHDIKLNTCRLQQEEDLQPSHEEADSISDLIERISKLQEQLVAASSKSSYQRIILHRLFCGDFLVKKLFPDTETENPSQDQQSEMNQYATVVGKNDELCTKILQQHQALIESQQELDELKQKNFKIKQANRKVMSKLEGLKESCVHTSLSDSDREAIQNAKDELKEAVAKINVVGNVFQGLIVGSGINWAADDNTRQLVLEIGEIMK